MNKWRYRFSWSNFGLVMGCWILGLSVFPLVAQTNPPAGGPSPVGEEDIHDIRGPIHLATGWEWVIWVVGALALAAVIWWWVNRRPPLKVKLPHELALERLQRARQLMQPGKAREFSSEVSEIARNYIEDRFQVLAASRTTEEFLYDLVSTSDTRLTENRPILADFLRHCDLAKFAGWSLTEAEMDSMYRCVEIFVRQTIPQPTTANNPAQKTVAPVPA